MAQKSQLDLKEIVHMNSNLLNEGIQDFSISAVKFWDKSTNNPSNSFLFKQSNTGLQLEDKHWTHFWPNISIVLLILVL